jgi:hypothetical protein
VRSKGFSLKLMITYTVLPMRFRWLVVAGWLVAGITSVACTQVLGVEDTTLSAVGGGGSGGSPGLSLPAACTGSEAPDDSETIPLTIHAVEFTSQKPASGISVRAFRSATDFSTFKTSVACGVSDSSGTVALSLPAPAASGGYTGFLFVSGAEQESFFYFFSPALSAPEEFGFLSLSNGDWSALRGALQLPDLPATHGQVTINALTKEGDPLGDVRFTIGGADEETKAFYFTDTGAPSLSQTKTSKPGFGGFFNVPAGGGTKQIQMIRDTDGVVLGSIDIYVYAGAWTTMRIRSSEPTVEANPGAGGGAAGTGG